MLKRVLLGILVVLVVSLAALSAVVALQPSEFHIARSATMAAPPEAVFAQVNDFHRWQQWSPWAKLDPEAQTTFEGAESGTGACFRWAGNEEVGQGSMTITDSQPPERVRIRLDFIKPFEDTCDVEFDLEPLGDQTRVTWSMSGRNNFIGKAMWLLVDCEQMIGEKYDEGLASIKALVETPRAE
jgi:uncharacterized protein YndB with AHSA1/START domain